MVDTYALGAYAAMCKSSSLLGGTKKKYADLLAYINYNTYLCNIKLKQYDRYIWR